MMAMPCAVVSNSAVGMRRSTQSAGAASLRTRLPTTPRVHSSPILPLQSWNPNSGARRAVPRAAATSGGSGGSQGGGTEEPIGKRLYRSASGAFDSAKKAVEDLDKEHELRQKAAELRSTAGKKAKETYAQVEDDLKRAAREVDRKYEVRGKTEQTFKSIKEGAQSVDQQLGIRKKLQNIADDVKRGWPDFKRRAQKFLNSPLGQGVTFAAVLYGLVSGILFKVMGYMLLLFWALTIFGVPQRIVQRMQQQQQQQAGAGPGGPGGRASSSGGYYSGGPTGGFSGYQQQYQQQQQQRGAAGGAGGSRQQQQAPGAGGGEVIDVEWDSIEEKRK